MVTSWVLSPMTKRSRTVPVASLSLAVLLLASHATSTPVTGAPATTPKEASDLFNTTNVWNIHLKFTADQWDAMEPAGGGNPFGGGRGQGPGQGGPRGPGGPGGFGPAMFIAPAFLSQGDKDRDGKISKTEFTNLGESWFGAWDKEKKGTLHLDQIRDGINASFAGPAGNSGPGGNAPRPMGLNLQGPEGKRNGLASAAGVEFKYVHADLEFENSTLKDIAIRYKGNGTFMGSRGSIKRSFKIDLNKNVKGQKIAGIAQFSLANNVTDATWMNETLAYKLHRDAGVPAPRNSYARVSVTVPGKFEKKYFGLYSLVEDVDKDFTSQNFKTKQGAILKPVTPRLFTDLGDDWAKYNQTYDPKTDLSKEEKQRVIDFCKLVSNADENEFRTKVESYLDLENFARYLAVTVWLSDLDGILGPGQNFYLHLNPKSQKFQFIAWDQDHSFGQFGMRGNAEQRENLSIEKPWQGENPFLERIFKVEAFKKLYLARMTEFSKTIFQPQQLAKQMDDLAPILRPSVKEESEDLLKNFERQVAGEPVQQGPGGFGGFGGGGQPMKTIKPFAKTRTQSILDQLSGKSKGQELDGFGGFGARGGGPRGAQGGPPGPGLFLGNAFLTALDADNDMAVTHSEFSQGFSKWFTTWNKDKSGVLSDEDLRSGINQDLAPFRGGPPRQ